MALGESTTNLPPVNLEGATRRDWIAAQLRIRRINNRTICRRFKRSEGYISDVLAGRERPPLLQEQIARMAGYTNPLAFWGELAADELKRRGGIA